MAVPKPEICPDGCSPRRVCVNSVRKRNGGRIYAKPGHCLSFVICTRCGRTIRDE